MHKSGKCVLMEMEGWRDGGVSRPVTEGAGRTWKKPGGMGPPGMASLGGMLPITGLGAAAALWNGEAQTRLPDFHPHAGVSTFSVTLQAAVGGRRQQGAVSAPASTATPPTSETVLFHKL